MPNSTLDFLYGLQYRGMKFGLRNITTLLASVGNPHTRFPAIHIAGTNGKGSTSAFIASICMEHGLRTGLYTSPHLVRFTERIRVDGKEMPVSRLVSYTRQLRPAIEKVGATFFEATTAICFLYFAEEKIDVGVIETGMGGRLDSTNVLTPLVSVITNVSLEHREYLGNTVRAIAREKGGIIKRRVPCVTGTADPAALSVLRSIAARRNAQLIRSRVVEVKRNRRDETIAVTSRIWGTLKVRPGLQGSYQHENVRLAVAAIELLARHGFPTPDGFRRQKIISGISRVAANSGMRGRFERVGKNILLDVAHNPAGIRALVSTVREKKFTMSAIVFGVMRDKEIVPMLARLKGLAPLVVAVAPRTGRARSAEEIKNESRFFPVTAASTVGSGLRYALDRTRGREVVLVTGSHYVVGEALSWLGRKKLDNTS